MAAEMMSMSVLTTSSTSDIGIWRSLTVISKELPIRSPSCIALLPVYIPETSTSFRFILDRSSGGHLKDISCVVTARLSFVPANPILVLDMPSERDIMRTRRFVSQLRLVTVAIVYSPPSFSRGGSEISLTTKSSGSVLRCPPVPSVSQRYLRIPMPASAVRHSRYRSITL